MELDYQSSQIGLQSTRMSIDLPVKSGKVEKAVLRKQISLCRKEKSPGIFSTLGWRQGRNMYSFLFHNELDCGVSKISWKKNVLGWDLKVRRSIVQEGVVEALRGSEGEIATSLKETTDLQTAKDGEGPKVTGHDTRDGGTEEVRPRRALTVRA